MTQANPKSSDRALLKAERKDKVLQYRIQGHTIKRAAEIAGVSIPTAYGYIREALHELAQTTALNTDEYRAIELERIESLERQAKSTLTGRDQIDALVKIHDRRVKLLDLLAPTRHVHTDGIDEIAFANGEGGDALERLRRARAEKAEIELEQIKNNVITVAEVKEKFALLVRHLGRAADEMRRRGYHDAQDILNAAIDGIMRDEQKSLTKGK